MSTSSTRCAACKSLRRRCPRDCILAPYFPSTNPQRFAFVHKIFGASNITKILQQVPVHYRAEAANTMSFEATSRVRDPVYGCVGIISQLQQQIIMQEEELAKAQGQLAFYIAQTQQQQLALSQARHGEPSWSSLSQDEPALSSSQEAQQQQQQQQNLNLAQMQYGETPWFTINQSDHLYFGQQLVDFNQQHNH